MLFIKLEFCQRQIKFVPRCLQDFSFLFAANSFCFDGVRVGTTGNYWLWRDGSSWVNWYLSEPNQLNTGGARHTISSDLHAQTNEGYSRKIMLPTFANYHLAHNNCT